MVYTDKHNLVADTEEQLHTFARKLNLGKKFFNADTCTYTIPEFLQKKALKLGAKLTKSRHLLEINNL